MTVDAAALIECWARKTYPDMCADDNFAHEWTRDGLLLCWYDDQHPFSGSYKEVSRLDLDDLIAQLVEAALQDTDDILAQSIAVGREWKQIAADLRAALASVVGSNVGTWEAVRAYDQKVRG